MNTNWHDELTNRPYYLKITLKQLNWENISDVYKFGPLDAVTFYKADLNYDMKINWTKIKPEIYWHLNFWIV